MGTPGTIQENFLKTGQVRFRLKAHPILGSFLNREVPGKSRVDRVTLFKKIIYIIT